MLFSVVIPFVVFFLAFLFLCCCFLVLFMLAGDPSYKGFDSEFLFLFLFFLFSLLILLPSSQMVYSVYPALAKLSKKAGKKGYDDVNEMRQKKRSLQPKPLVIGTSVMKEVDKRTTKW